MKKRTSDILTIGGFLSLLLFPFLNYTSTNYLDPSFAENVFLSFSLGFMLVVSILIICVFVLLRLVNKNISLTRFLVTAAVTFVLLFYLPLAIEQSGGSKLGIILFVGINALCVVMALGIYIATKSDHFFTFIKIAAIAITITPLVEVVPQIFISRIPNTVTSSVPMINGEQAPVPKRNLYYFILDGHSSIEWLSAYGYKNDEFLNRMDQLGYYHAVNAKSSYNTTHLTLSSIFEANYFLTDTSPVYLNRRDFFPRIMSKSPPPFLVRYLQSINYDIYWAGNHWGSCRDKYVACIGTGRKSSIPQTIKEFFPNNIFYKIYWRIKKHQTPEMQADSKIDVGDAIGHTLSLLQNKGVSSQPGFYFIHHFPPHDPYKYKKDCTIRDFFEFDLTSMAADEEIPLYLDNVGCTQKRILQIAEFLAANDPEATVVFQGDHGADFDLDWELPLNDWTDRAIDERLSIINFLKVPAACQPFLNDSLNNVNSIRLAVACGLDRDPVLLENLSFLGGYESNPDFGSLRKVQSE